MGKRKRDRASKEDDAQDSHASKKSKKPQAAFPPMRIGNGPVTIQLVAGSYDRVLHGVTASIPVVAQDSLPKVEKGSSNQRASHFGKAQFSDTFLFNAHASAIRCLALSPPSAPVRGQTQKVVLATGSTDERINLYNLSAHPPSASSLAIAKTIAGEDAADADNNADIPRPVRENPKHRELGTLLHHSSTVTRLCFPLRSKLLSAAEDSTVAVTRTRDWNVLHAFKCPVPKAQGRPSGDTAALGGVPSGVNDFAVHPSMTIMITVSRGERCMRLWNLVTGKKAGVHNFPRAMLAEIGEGRHSTGEARRIGWGSCKGEDEFAVGFDRDVVVFGMDIKPKCRLFKDVRTKANEFCYVKIDEEKDETLLAVSTDDGRILFFSTDVEKQASDEDAGEGEEQAGSKSGILPNAKLVAQLGGKDVGVDGRIKDFSVLPFEAEDGSRSWFILTGSSDGKLRVWELNGADLRSRDGKESKAEQVGSLLGTYDTPNRITCVGGFIMIPKPDGAEESEYEFDDAEADTDESEDEGEK